MSTKYPQGVITATPPFQSTTAQSFSGVWTLEQLGKNYFYYQQPVAKSLRFRSSASAYLNRTPSTGGNRTTWTWSGWVKRGALGTAQTIFSGGLISGTYYYTQLYFDTNNALVFYSYPDTADTQATTSAVYRDPSSWYHIVLAVDKTQATNSNGVQIWVNGAQQNLTFASYSQNVSTMVNTTSYTNWVGKFVTGGAGNYFDGYLAEVNFIDGQALDASYFGQLSTITGVWAPKKYVGSYGTNGFYLPFTDATSTTTLGYDASGNSNNWTTNNISLTSGSTYDSMWDSPTSYDNGVNGVGNYAALNPNDKALANIAISNGNLTATGSATNYGVRGSFGVTSGSWYYEASVNGTAVPAIGIATSGWVLDYVGDGVGAGNIGYHANGIIYSNGVAVQSGLASYTSGDIVGVAYNVTSGSIQFYKNNVAIGTAVTGFAGLNIFPAVSTQTSTVVNVNFGQRPFTYTPPTGFKALNTQNLPAVSIANGANHMAASLFTGNNQPNESVLNSYNSVGFKPDFVWMKSRSNSQSNYLVDSVRGGSSLLRSDTAGAESTGSVWIQSFDASGFTATNNVISNGYTYVGWQWKAGGTAVTNTAGSITSSVSANPTAGFSVVTFTNVPTTNAAYTIGHGLGVAPSFYIIKARSYAGNWDCYHASLGNASDIRLNLTNAVVTPYGGWQNTSPTSSVFTINGSYFSTSTSDTFVAYCFAAIPGYSAFGSYTGNGSSDGPFVYCGFRPRFVLIKRTDAAGSWVIDDSSRDPYNVAGNTLFPNSSAAESASNVLMDMVANGFKMRGVNVNDSGGTFIYAAFAENPFKYSLAR